MSRPASDPIPLFWSHVAKGDGDNACWLWTAQTDGNRYGIYRTRTHREWPKQAHLVAWMLIHGARAPANRTLTHRCGVRHCVRPDHLVPGRTHAVSLEHRFWAKVDQSGDGCWVWTASLNRKGYGQIMLRRRPVGAHRVAWALAHGGELPSLCVLHRCDNPRCVRPEHLFLGTIAENNRDMWRKGRARPGHLYGRGSAHFKAKLTEDDVRRIRANYDGKRGTISALARAHGVSVQTMFCVVRGKNWTHVEAAA